VDLGGAVKICCCLLSSTVNNSDCCFVNRKSGLLSMGLVINLRILDCCQSCRCCCVVLRVYFLTRYC